MSVSRKIQHLKRYKDIALLVLKYADPDMKQQFSARSELLEDEVQFKADQKASPEQLANDLEAMGPTFVKLGQVLSSRSDLLPPPYLRALSRLQDRVKPFPYEQVEEIIQRELGVRISKAFNRFDREPLAAASLGQVHCAELRNGRPVVVKVQRPDIRQLIAEDLEVLEEIAQFLGRHTKTGRRYQFTKLFEEFQRTLIHELDYHREAANMASIHENLKEFEHVVVPLPVSDYTTREVLTMDYIPGKKTTSINPLDRLDLDGCMLADQLLYAYLKQVLVDGMFHADPHPGNIFLTEDRRLALLDLGMVGRTSPEMQENLIRLLIAITEGNGDMAAEIATEISETTQYFDQPEFRRKIVALVAEEHESELQQLDVGRVLLEVGRAAGETGLYVPVELSLLGKTLLQLDQIGRNLDEKFNPNEAVRRHVTSILNQRLRRDMSSRTVLSSLLDVKDFAAGLPHRINKILDAVADSQLEVNVKATDISDVIDGFQKIANRITAGLVLAALIVGAALLMQVQTKFQILGYPGIAMLCFLAAATGGFWLVIDILLRDKKARHHARRRR